MPNPLIRVASREIKIALSGHNINPLTCSLSFIRLEPPSNALYRTDQDAAILRILYAIF